MRGLNPARDCPQPIAQPQPQPNTSNPAGLRCIVQHDMCLRGPCLLHWPELLPEPQQPLHVQLH
jgi:hypothetical protein